jgi:hypothetical protein
VKLAKLKPFAMIGVCFMESKSFLKVCLCPRWLCKCGKSVNINGTNTEVKSYSERKQWYEDIMQEYDDVPERVKESSLSSYGHNSSVYTMTCSDPLLRVPSNSNLK